MRRLRISPSARASRVGEDLVLLQLDRGTYYSLNSTGAWLWEQIGDGATLTQLCASLAEEFGTDAATARNDLTELVDALVAEGLVTLEEDER